MENQQGNEIIKFLNQEGTIVILGSLCYFASYRMEQISYMPLSCLFSALFFGGIGSSFIESCTPQKHRFVISSLLIVLIPLTITSKIFGFSNCRISQINFERN